jgi:magnesium and cobalt exporter, CNNM family
MIPLVASGFCFLVFLLLEFFYQALDRLSPIRLRGMLEEHPRRFALLSGRGEAAVVKTSVKVLVQLLLLAGLITLVRGLERLSVANAWAWGGGMFLVGWLLTEGAILRAVSRIEPEVLLSRLVPALSAVSWLVVPLALPVRILFARKMPREENPASEEDIQAYIDVGREEGILEKEEGKMLLSIVGFGETMVKEVMTPRTDIVGIDAAATLSLLADLFIESKYSRLPVYRGSLDTVVGVVHVKDAFQAIRGPGEAPIVSLAREPFFVPETKKTSELLRDFQRRRQQMAIVVDEYGGVSGLVTIEDLLEEIVGEISDEYEDERDPVIPAGPEAYSLAGRVHIRTLEELFGRGPEEEGADFDTLAGFLSARLGRIPRKGETYAEGGLLYTIEEADRRRVHRIRVERAAAASERTTPTGSAAAGSQPAPGGASRDARDRR